MSRLKRIEFRGALHLVRFSGPGGKSIFFEARRVHLAASCARSQAGNERLLESLLWETCDQYNAAVHAYEVEPNSGMLVVETDGAPLAWIMHDVLGRYARHLRQAGTISPGERPFPRRFQSQIVQPGLLPYAVRRVHKAPVLAGLCHHGSSYPFSSDGIYAGRRGAPTPVCIADAKSALERLRYSGRAGYFEFMSKSDTPSIAQMFSQRLVGDAEFCTWARARAKAPWQALSLPEIAAAVGKMLGMTAQFVDARTHQGARARALVAWYSMRTGSACLAEVARRFGITGSNLRYLIRAHRNSKPLYFEQPLPVLFPDRGFETGRGHGAMP